MGGRNHWSQEEFEWLREEYPRHNNRDLPSMHRERFPDAPKRSLTAIRTMAAKMGVSKAEDFNATPPTFWTPDKVEWFRGFVPGHEEHEISAEHERIYGTPLSKNQINNAKCQFNVRSGTSGGSFKKGNVPWVKGRKWDEWMPPEKQELVRSKHFKKGGAFNWSEIIPVGTERVRTTGYTDVKVADRPSVIGGRDNWQPKQRVVYEQHHGPIPEGWNVVFADGDKTNFDPENLVAAPRGLLGIMHKQNIPHCDRESFEVAVNIAKLISVRTGVIREVKGRA